MKPTVEDVVRLVAETAVEHAAAWDRLDSATGDGDFGTTMGRGFGAVLAGWGALDASSVGTLLASVADVLSTEMGGSSGPLWSDGVRRCGEVFGRQGVGLAAVADAIGSVVIGVSAFGGAEVGDKTLLDALVPMSEALRAAAAAELDVEVAVRLAAEAAVRGAESTVPIRAQRGRAAWVGNRSIGHVDPGAAAIALLAVRVARLFGIDVPGLATPEPPRTSVAAVRGAAKQFVNAPEDAVAESLQGLAMAHPDLLVFDPVRRIVRRSTASHGLVGLVAGGGSGHEPLHAGFVGPGMLTAAAPGPVFASPTVHQIFEATMAADHGAGVLQLIKNYTGDVMNFGAAADMARAEGVRVESVVIADDVGVDDLEHDVGRRGTGATVFVEKVAGAAAEEGRDLATVTALARRVLERAASFGVALGSCSPPGRGPILELGDDDIEIGVGIHGEAGRRRDRMRTAHDLTGEIVAALLARLRPVPGAELFAMVSGLGATTMMEHQIVYRELELAVRGAGHSITRRLVGPYLTALDMPGVLVTLVVLDDELVQLWDAPVHTPALRWLR